jgi:hypothetical protein
MTGGTKMLFAGSAWIGPVGIRVDVAVDAFFQAVFVGADTTVHGLIALMKYELHMVATHVLGWLYTLLSLCLRYLRDLRIRDIGTGDEGLAGKCQSHDCNQGRS